MRLCLIAAANNSCVAISCEPVAISFNPSSSSVSRRLRINCAWRRAGSPVWDGPPRTGQTYEGTDRQCRGALLAVLRSHDDPVEADELDRAWPEPVQRSRALASLVADGLVVEVGCRWALPH